MLRVCSWLMFIVGACVLLYGSWQIIGQEAAQSRALAQAEQIVSFGDVTAQEDGNDVEQIVTAAMEYAVHRPAGNVLGILEIPRLEATLPIISGTDDKELERGVGHLRETALPGQNDQILLAGHRDTVFRRLGELEIGDLLVVHMSYGTYRYQIHNTAIVAADDASVIRSTAPEEVLTLSTCYPFRVIGYAPERYILYALPVNE